MKIFLKKRIICFILIFLVELFVFYLGKWSVKTEINVILPMKNEETESIVPLPKTYLLILIMSSPSEFDVRSTIRNTWLKLSAKGPNYFRWVFPIGIKKMDTTDLTKLTIENETFFDLAFLPNVTESYDGLARKTAFSIDFAIKNYQFDYLLKVDSDSFVRVGAVLKSLRDIAHPKLYWGFLDGRAKPFRNGKWKEIDWILCDRYLPYQV